MRNLSDYKDNFNGVPGLHREIKLVCFGIYINFYFHFDLVFSIKQKTKLTKIKFGYEYCYVQLQTVLQTVVI